MNRSFKEFKKTRRGRKALYMLAGALKGIYFLDCSRSADISVEDVSGDFSRICAFGINVSATKFLSVRLGWKHRSKEIVEDLVEILGSDVDVLKHGERDSYCEIVEDAIHDALRIPQVFHLRQVYGEANLFSIIASENPIQSIDYLLDFIHYQLRKSTCEWLTIYPLRRLSSPSVAVGFEGMSLINPKDADVWNVIAKEYAGAGKWYVEEPNNAAKLFPKECTSWLLCQHVGTVDGARNHSARSMREFVALLLSVLSESCDVLTRVAAEPHHYSVQFPLATSQSSISEMNADIGELFPSMPLWVVISKETLSRVESWFKKKASLPNADAERLTAAAQFVGYALVAGRLERFIHFFISLDALFGERGKVEAMITQGVKDTFPGEAIWEYKISRLFLLRSSIVHGGCSSIEQWDGYQSYCRHTRSHPERDVAIAAMTALLRN